METLIVDSAESITQKRKSGPYFADQNEWHVTILGKMNIINFGHRVGVRIGVSGAGWGGGRMESSWEVLVLPVIFITPGKRAILFPFVNTFCEYIAKI